MIDRLAGTDFKALAAKLETNYQIRRLTETGEDIAKEARLEKSRSALIEKIQQAKEYAAANGVDAKLIDAADAHLMQKEACRGTPQRASVDPG